MRTECWWRYPKEKDPLEDLGLNGGGGDNIIMGP